LFLSISDFEVSIILSTIYGTSSSEGNVNANGGNIELGVVGTPGVTGLWGWGTPLGEAEVVANLGETAAEAIDLGEAGVTILGETGPGLEPVSNSLGEIELACLGEDGAIGLREAVPAGLGEGGVDNIGVRGLGETDLEFNDIEPSGDEAETEIGAVDASIGIAKRPEISFEVCWFDRDDIRGLTLSEEEFEATEVGLFGREARRGLTLGEEDEMIEVGLSLTIRFALFIFGLILEISAGEAGNGWGERIALIWGLVAFTLFGRLWCWFGGKIWCELELLVE